MLDHFYGLIPFPLKQPYNIFLDLGVVQSRLLTRPILGSAGERVKTLSYGSELEDFGRKDSSHLDTWVFDKVFFIIKFLKYIFI